MVDRPVTRGDRVRVRDALGRWHDRRALTGPVRGHRFPIIWVTDEAVYQRAIETGIEPQDVPSELQPWPAEAVELVGVAS